MRQMSDSWNEALTLEQFVKKAIEDGNEELVLVLLKLLPPEKKLVYRGIWKLHKGEK